MAIPATQQKQEPLEIYCPLDESPFVVEKETLWTEALDRYLEGAFAEAAKAFACLPSMPN